MDVDSMPETSAGVVDISAKFQAVLEAPPGGLPFVVRLAMLMREPDVASAKVLRLTLPWKSLDAAKLIKGWVDSCPSGQIREAAIICTEDQMKQDPNVFATVKWVDSNKI